MQSILRYSLLWLLFPKSIQAISRFDDEISNNLLEKGRIKLTELEEKSHLPRYGECWLHALDHLRDGCRMLTDTIQVDMALHFTDCFLEMSGQERLDCVSERTEALKRLCMSDMSDRAFAVYTEFFTQTQNMCFFLQSQRWQSETDRTIDRLSVTSKEVSDQLQVAGEIQQKVLHHQKEGLKLQEEMLKISDYLAKTLNGSQEMLDRLTLELKNSTEEHQSVLKELFREIYILHSWIVGRYAFIDRILFYFCLMAMVMIATSTKRTNNARPYLILNSMACFLLELVLPQLLASVDDIQKNRVHWVVRNLFVLSGLIIFGFYCYRHQDKNAKLLNEIKEQNRQIMDSILRLKMEAPLNAPLGNKSESQKSFSTAYESRKNYHPLLRKIPLQSVDDTPSQAVEPDTTDYNKENASNERRSTRSRSLRLTPERREVRATSRTSESSVSHASRYNLRRKVANK